MIKTFRGSLADGEQQVIRLSTKKGKIGYRIKKLQVVTTAPGTNNGEHVIKIFKISQSTINALIDFADGNLLAIALTGDYTAGYQFGWNQHIMFEQEIFNQDIYITHKEGVNALACNYYLELELIDLTDNAAAVSTLRDIRLNPQVGG